MDHFGVQTKKSSGRFSPCNIVEIAEEQHVDFTRSFGFGVSLQFPALLSSGFLLV